jgi:glyoxalase family protein
MDGEAPDRGNGMHLEGIHHISCITGDAPRNVEFYVGLLGMRLVKKTVNQDDPSVYHLFYGDEEGSPGFDLTFFEYPGAAPGLPGPGMIHRIVWRVRSTESIAWWRDRLGGAGVETREEGDSLLFSDPEGLSHELIVYDGPDPDLVPLHSEVPPEHAIRGFDSVRAWSVNGPATGSVLVDVLGFDQSGPNSWTTTDGGRTGTYVLDDPPGHYGRPGAGTVHHIAWATRLDQQEDWQKRVAGSGLFATPVIDRFYFEAVYFREPGGVLFELATMGPGFATDEEPDSLGERLALPPDFEAVREQVEPQLTPLPDVRQWRPATT